MKSEFKALKGEKLTVVKRIGVKFNKSVRCRKNVTMAMTMTERRI